MSEEISVADKPAIEAVLYPADTDYLYFVADRQGHNHYSNTYAEHLAIVDEVR